MPSDSSPGRRVCHKGKFNFFIYFLLRFSPPHPRFDPPLPPACCVCCQGQISRAVTLPSSFPCRGHITHFRVVEPRLCHPEPGRPWCVMDKKYRNVLFICSLSFYPPSCVISPPCRVIYSLTCASGCLFHPCRKHQVLPDGYNSIEQN